MTYFTKKTALSGWVLVAVLNIGTLGAQEVSDLPVAPSEEISPHEIEGSTGKVDEELHGSAGDAEPAESHAGADMDYLEVATKLGFGLGLVILLAWGTVFLLRKSSLGRQAGGVGKTIRVAERTYLSPKKAIYLVEIGDRTLALGVTEENITALSEWQAGELELAAAPAPVGSFAAQFRNLLGQATKEGS